MRLQHAGSSSRRMTPLFLYCALLLALVLTAIVPAHAAAPPPACNEHSLAHDTLLEKSPLCLS
jgi:hypothetical protein